MAGNAGEGVLVVPAGGRVPGSDTPCPPLQDAMRSVTKQAVKEARLREIKDELLNSEKLKVSPALVPGGLGAARGAEGSVLGVRGRGMGTGRCQPPPILRPQAYFEDNPRDLHVLRHDKPLHPAIVKPHLRNVPDYLGTSPCPPAGAGLGGEKEWDLGPWAVTAA